MGIISAGEDVCGAIAAKEVSDISYYPPCIKCKILNEKLQLILKLGGHQNWIRHWHRPLDGSNFQLQIHKLATSTSKIHRRRPTSWDRRYRTGENRCQTPSLH